MEHVDVLIESGFSKPVAKLELSHKEQIIRTVCLHKVILASLAELSQFRDGILKIEGMRNVLAKHATLLEPFFCMNKQDKLTSGTYIINSIPIL